MSMFFFFQAEDGIRDLVRSRGLGDVYKRQDQRGAAITALFAGPSGTGKTLAAEILANELDLEPVSYTHLTLPTSDLV